MRVMCLSVFLIIISCGAVKDAIQDLLSFDIDENIPEQSIDGTSIPCTAPEILGIEIFTMPPIKITKEEHFPNQGTKVNLIKTAKLKTFKLDVTDSSSEPDFDWLESIKLFASSENVEKVLIASLEDIQDGSSSINLNTLDVNIAPYLKDSSGFEISSEVSGCPPTQDFVFDGDIIINVSAISD